MKNRRGEAWRPDQCWGITWNRTLRRRVWTVHSILVEFAWTGLSCNSIVSVSNSHESKEKAKRLPRSSVWMINADGTSPEKDRGKWDFSPPLVSLLRFTDRSTEISCTNDIFLLRGCARVSWPTECVRLGPRSETTVSEREIIAPLDDRTTYLRILINVRQDSIDMGPIVMNRGDFRQ